MEQQKQFQCTGDCLKCPPVQRPYCAAQHSYNSMMMLQKMQESINAMVDEMSELKVKVSAIQDNEALVFNPNIAQEGDGAEE